ncbi:zinc finger protein 729-like [Athalia rosae]|uniref:zinc finger protein 729-like n=1 Tax=Athalia rosae TaxID=37344 RepID=UPI0020347D1D|nr:zinc finger protein 729-like [Athalia rosae]
METNTEDLKIVAIAFHEEHLSLAEPVDDGSVAHEATKQNMDAEEVNTSETPQNEDILNAVEICRVCLLESVEMKDLFLVDDVVSLSSKAMSFTNAKMLPGDGLPAQVCASCAAKLDAAYEFKLQVEQADGVLRERYMSLNIKDELFFNEVEIHLETNQSGDKIGEQSTDIDIQLCPESIQEAELNDTTEEPHLLEDDLALLRVKNRSEDQGSNSEVREVSPEGTENSETEPDIIQHTPMDPGRIVAQEHGYGAQLKSESDEHLLPGKSFGKSGQLSKSDENQLENVKLEESSREQTVTQKKKEQICKALPQIETRKSKRKSAQKLPIIDHDSDEDNYFENLNLSSRLKQSPPNKAESVYYMCYICDKHFLAKSILKEHMHSHEEVRKVMSLVKVPEKSPKITTPAKHCPSGKQPNKCPHCGKEYLYIISYKKHLKQHESEKEESKVEPMPLEVSFHEDDNTLDFENSDNSYDSDPLSQEGKHTCEKCKEAFSTKKALQKHMTKHEALMCNICNQEFGDLDAFKTHQTQHVSEEVLTAEDLEENLKYVSQLLESTHDDEGVRVRRKTRHSGNKGLQCPKCPMVYSHKKSLLRHLEIHTGIQYVCKLCSQQFSRKDHLRRHMEQHGRIKSFNCTQCNKTFGNELTLRNHLIATNHKTIIRGEEYDPNKRPKRVAAKEAQKIIDKIKTENDGDDNDSSDDVEQPRKRSYEKKEYECATCSSKCASKQSLAKHMEMHIKDEKSEKQINRGSDDDSDFDTGLEWLIDTHECPTCKKRYSTKKSLLRHQLLHEEPNFECDICNMKFYRKDKLKAHYDKCSEKNPDQVRKCNICGDSFENNNLLKEHRAKHVTEGILTEEDLRDIEPQTDEKRLGEKITRKRRTDIVGLECRECNKLYTSRKGLLRHIQVHEGKKYLCDICPKKFYRREHLKIHVAKHNMIKPHKCNRCTKRFAKEEQLTNHVSKHDRNFKKNKETDSSKRFLCEICSKSFTQSTTLIAHLRAHNGIKPYVCEVCSRPFTTNAYLKMHMRTHTQERPYTCQYCSRAFARADTLANHLTSHTGEAKYHCKYCPKNFRRLKSLKEHVFIHTGQRPYACPTCDRRFNNNGSRYAHSKRCKQNLLQNQNRGQESANQGRIHVNNPMQTVKPQSVKTITITSQADSVTGQQVIQHQEILMPLILPLTVTLADVGEEVILPEGTKIFTTS